MLMEFEDEYGKHKGSCISHEGIYKVVDCDICAYKHISPLPSTQALDKFYQEEYYQNEKVQYIYDNDRDFEWHKINFGVRLDLMEELMGGVGSVLDIGSGPGVFLRIAKEKGWKVAGVEPSPAAAKHANLFDLNVQNMFFSHENEFEPESFDFVHLSEVLEHVPEPKSILISAAKLLKPGGYLTASVPNDFNPFQKAAVHTKKVEREWWVFPEHHLNYFDFCSLERLMENVGLQLIDRTTNFPMEMFLLMDEDYTIDAKLGEKCHNRRKALDFALYEYDQRIYNNFYRQLAASNMGRVAVVTARK